MRTELIVLADTATYATSGTIDLYSDVPISLNFNIADIKEPQKRDADFSKTITVPGTNNNNNLLSHIYEIGIDRLFNPNHKTEVRILYGSIQVFKGYMRLAKIRKLKDEKIEYDLEVRGRLDDLFTNLTDLKLTDLSWTDLDHTYNRTNIVNSWSASVGSNYVYPFIDYGYEPNINNIAIDHLYPAVYIKEAWDRIFSNAGFQYSSTFLTSTFFKSLIMPFTGENMRLTSAQIQAREFQASRTSNQTHIPFNTSGTYNYFHNVYNDDSTSPNIDTGGCYNTTTGVYTVPANGYYYFTSNLTVDAIATPHLANQYINYYIHGFSSLVVNGSTKSFGGNFDLYFGTAQYSVAQSNTSSLGKYTDNYVTFSGFFSAGDTVFIQLEALLNANSAPALSGKPIGNVDYQLRVNTNSYFYAKAEPIIKNGDTITFANTLPSEMKVVDFLVSIIKMFNLYFEYDKDIPNKIYIETRNDFYNSTIQDWSSKLDAKQEPEIIPMGALNAKRYRFTYKEDGDVLNAIYKKTHGEIYGEKHRDIDNDFLKNTDTMELIFSPTPQYGIQGTGKFYPALYNVDSSMKIVHNKSMNPRILYYGGLKSCSTWYLYEVLSSSSFSYGTALTTYPYCGMMDDPSTPTISLDFEAPKEVFYTPVWQGSYTNNNLYNKYWSQFINEITDKDSSIVTAWFWLKPTDIMEVDFRHIYRFLNQNFRLNKIYDYNPSELSLTKCEFIKLKNGTPFVSSTKHIRGGSSDIFDGDSPLRVPSPPIQGNQGSNSLPAIGNIQQIQGSYNYISANATNVVINGDQNSVGAESNNIQIINSSGCIVAGGLINVSILNSSGITVLESNTSYINNVQVFSPSIPGLSEWVTSGTTIYNRNTGNVGIGTSNPAGKFQILDAPRSNPNASYTQAFLGTLALMFRGTGTDSYIANNAYYNNSNQWIYTLTGGANLIGFNATTGQFDFHTAPSGTAGNVITFTKRLSLTQDGRLYGTALHNNAGAVTGAINQYIASGTYTPTAADNTNLDANPSTFQAMWIRVGNIVTVSGTFNANPTATGAVGFSLTLPIASVMSAITNLTGQATMAQIAAAENAMIYRSGNLAYVTWTTTDIVDRNWYYTFTYEVLA